MDTLVKFKFLLVAFMLAFTFGAQMSSFTDTPQDHMDSQHQLDLDDEDSHSPSLDDKQNIALLIAPPPFTISLPGNTSFEETRLHYLQPHTLPPLRPPLV